MGKIISLINTTPDGFVDARYADIDAGYFEFVHDIIDQSGCIAFGRKSFELFQSVWPARLESETTTAWQLKMARALNDKPKTVYSSSLSDTHWANTTIKRSVDPGQLMSVKQDGGLLTFASLHLVASMTALHLIDEYYFCVQPMLAGGGAVRLFDTIRLPEPQSLVFAGSKSLASGVHIVHYKKGN